MLDPATATHDELVQEVYRITHDPVYFIDNYCYIEDKVSKSWVRFNLWECQQDFIRAINDNKLVIALKTRQIGWTWTVLAEIIWMCLTGGDSKGQDQHILMFSVADREAMELMHRLQGMYDRLPAWIKQDVRPVKRNDHELEFNNGARVSSLPSNRGDSYACSFVFCDEFDLIPAAGQERLLKAVEPTISDGSGKLVLLSKADKSKPMSRFKEIYRAAQRNENDFVTVFAPWSAHPNRDAAWYTAAVRNNTQDDLWENYPATPEQALSEKIQSKYLDHELIDKCFHELKPGTYPKIHGLQVFVEPRKGGRYCIGTDSSEGNPRSDDAVISVVDVNTNEECALLVDKMPPDIQAAMIVKISEYYNKAPAMVERNAMGHEVIRRIAEHAAEHDTYTRILTGPDGKQGFSTGLSASRKGSKLTKWEVFSDCLREENLTIHSRLTYTQLCAIDGVKLKAPEGLYDDVADAFCLAVYGAEQLPKAGQAQAPVTVEKIPKPSLFGQAQQMALPPRPGEFNPKSSAIRVGKPRQLFGQHR